MSLKFFDPLIIIFVVVVLGFSSKSYIVVSVMVSKLIADLIVLYGNGRDVCSTAFVSTKSAVSNVVIAVGGVLRYPPSYPIMSTPHGMFLASMHYGLR